MRILEAMNAEDMLVDGEPGSELKIPDPPCLQELQTFEAGARGGPTIANFRLDFRKGKCK